MQSLNFLDDENENDNDSQNDNDNDACTEFVLVDGGELVEISAPYPNTVEQEEMEYLRRGSRASCRSSRKMGKGIRGSIKKWD